VIHVAPAPPPKTFEKKVREPGLAFLKERKGDEPLEPHWTKALDDLMSAYHEICAYSCFRIHPITGARSTDHFAAKSLDAELAYEWSNYRLCCSRLNSRKRAFDDVLDPFLIQTGWFQLELVGFQVLPDPELPEVRKREVQDTIDRLGLNDFRSEREAHAEDYWHEEISLKVLRRESPFVAEELRRHGRLNSGDT